MRYFLMKIDRKCKHKKAKAYENKLKKRSEEYIHTQNYGNMLLVCCQLLLKLNEKKNKNTNLKTKMIKRFVTLML